MKQLTLIITIYLFFGCQENSPPIAYESKGVIAGEWKFVNQFSENKVYDCLLCADFIFEKAENTLTLHKDLTVNAKIGTLILKGTYSFNEESNTFNPQIYRDLFSAKGVLAIKTFDLINKPPQTEAQTKLIESIKNTNNYILYTNIQQSLQVYDQLKMYYSPTEYLFFVRKKLN